MPALPGATCGHVDVSVRLTIAIPTYLREQVLVDTCRQVLEFMEPATMELLIVDDSPAHEPEVGSWLEQQSQASSVRWIRASTGSLTAARNLALHMARGEIVLFLDDDIMVPPDLFTCHLSWYRDPSIAAVTGEVYNCLDPDHPPPMDRREENTVRHSGVDTAQEARNTSGGNHSVRRSSALRIGGYDEQFVGSCQGEDLDFSQRLVVAGHRIMYDPDAWILHIGARAGGCGVAGTTHWPEWTHSANLFMYAFRHGRRQRTLRSMLWRALRNGPLRKENVVHPTRWWRGWWGCLCGLRYGWAHRKPPARLDPGQTRA